MLVESEAVSKSVFHMTFHPSDKIVVLTTRNVQILSEWTRKLFVLPAKKCPYFDVVVLHCEIILKLDDNFVTRQIISKSFSVSPFVADSSSYLS
jgi:hypothetical protein